MRVKWNRSLDTGTQRNRPEPFQPQEFDIISTNIAEDVALGAEQSLPSHGTGFFSLFRIKRHGSSRKSDDGQSLCSLSSSIAEKTGERFERRVSLPARLRKRPPLPPPSGSHDTGRIDSVGNSTTNFEVPNPEGDLSYALDDKKYRFNEFMNSKVLDKREENESTNTSLTKSTSLSECQSATLAEANSQAFPNFSQSIKSLAVASDSTAEKHNLLDAAKCFFSFRTKSFSKKTSSGQSSAKTALKRSVSVSGGSAPDSRTNASCSLQRIPPETDGHDGANSPRAPNKVVSKVNEFFSSLRHRSSESKSSVSDSKKSLQIENRTQIDKLRLPEEYQPDKVSTNSLADNMALCEQAVEKKCTFFETAVFNSKHFDKQHDFKPAQLEYYDNMHNHVENKSANKTLINGDTKPAACANNQKRQPLSDKFEFDENDAAKDRSNISEENDEDCNYVVSGSFQIHQINDAVLKQCHLPNNSCSGTPTADSPKQASDAPVSPCDYANGGCMTSKEDMQQAELVSNCQSENVDSPRQFQGFLDDVVVRRNCPSEDATNRCHSDGKQSTGDNFQEAEKSISKEIDALMECRIEAAADNQSISRVDNLHQLSDDNPYENEIESVLSLLDLKNSFNSLNKCLEKNYISSEERVIETTKMKPEIILNNDLNNSAFDKESNGRVFVVYQTDCFQSDVSEIDYVKEQIGDTDTPLNTAIKASLVSFKEEEKVAEFDTLGLPDHEETGTLSKSSSSERNHGMPVKLLASELLADTPECRRTDGNLETGRKALNESHDVCTSVVRGQRESLCIGSLLTPQCTEESIGHQPHLVDLTDLDHTVHSVLVNVMTKVCDVTTPSHEGLPSPKIDDSLTCQVEIKTKDSLRELCSTYLEIVPESESPVPDVLPFENSDVTVSVNNEYSDLPSIQESEIENVNLFVRENSKSPCLETVPCCEVCELIASEYTEATDGVTSEISAVLRSPEENTESWILQKKDKTGDTAEVSSIPVRTPRNVMKSKIAVKRKTSTSKDVDKVTVDVKTPSNSDLTKDIHQKVPSRPNRMKAKNKTVERRVLKDCHPKGELNVKQESNKPEAQCASPLTNLSLNHPNLCDTKSLSCIPCGGESIPGNLTKCRSEEYIHPRLPQIDLAKDNFSCPAIQNTKGVFLQPSGDSITSNEPSRVPNLSGPEPMGVKSSSPQGMGQVHWPHRRSSASVDDIGTVGLPKHVPKDKSRIPRKQGGINARPLVAPRPIRPPMWLSKAELSLEIQRLSTLCETRTKELNRLKLETRHATTGFDALGVVIRYMTAELNAFGNPMLVTDLREAQENLTQGKKNLEYYENEIEKLNLLHVKEVNNISEKLLKEHEGKFQELIQKHNEQITILDEKHEKEARSLTEALKASCEEEKQQHQKMLNDLQQELKNQREEMEIFHQHELFDLEEGHLEKQKTLMAEVEKLQKQCEDAKVLSLNMEDALQKDTDSKLQWLSAKRLDLQNEVDSLKAVLEIKNNELHSLRKENLEMQKELEDLPLAREKIKMLQARAEDLQALMAEKVRLERQLSTEHHAMKEIYEREEKVNKRLSMENEELAWRLKQANESSLLSTSVPDEEEPEELLNEACDLSSSCPPAMFEPPSPVRSPKPVNSRPMFFTYMNQDELNARSPMSPKTQYKRIQPHRSSTKSSSQSPSPHTSRRCNDSSPHTSEGTPRKMARQISRNAKDMSSRRRSRGSSSENKTTGMTTDSVPDSLLSSASSENSLYDPCLLDDHREHISSTTLQILQEQSSTDASSLHFVNDNLLLVNANETLDTSSEVIDPKTYYHMTFPVRDTAPEAEDAVKETAQE